MNIKGDLCWCQRFKTCNWPVRSGVSLSLFLCPEIDFADLALSLWNALGMCVYVCVCVCVCLSERERRRVCECVRVWVRFTARRTVYHMHTHTAGRGHLGLFCAERERGRAEPVERALIKMREGGSDFITWQTDDQMNREGKKRSKTRGKKSQRYKAAAEDGRMKMTWPRFTVYLHYTYDSKEWLLTLPVNCCVQYMNVLKHSQ